MLVLCLTLFVLYARQSQSSFPRKREGGFTFEVQQVTAENLCRGFVVKTLSRSVIIGTHQGEQALIGPRGKISFPRQSSAHASDGVFNAALLPRCKIGRASCRERV